MKTIGITGGVGAGKSRVLQYIGENYKAFIIFSDNLAKELEMPGGPCYEPIVSLLGRDILSENGEINPKAMAGKIFNNGCLLKKVNDIVHPAVKERILYEIETKRREGQIDYFFVEAALLIECGYKEILDEIWFVHADAAVRRERLKESRGYSDEKIDGILASQLSDEIFLENADFVLENGADFEKTIISIDKRLKV